MEDIFKYSFFYKVLIGDLQTDATLVNGWGSMRGCQGIERRWG